MKVLSFYYYWSFFFNSRKLSYFENVFAIIETKFLYLLFSKHNTMPRRPRTVSYKWLTWTVYYTYVFRRYIIASSCVTQSPRIDRITWGRISCGHARNLCDTILLLLLSFYIRTYYIVRRELRINLDAFPKCVKSPSSLAVSPFSRRRQIYRAFRLPPSRSTATRRYSLSVVLYII